MLFINVLTQLKTIYTSLVNHSKLVLKLVVGNTPYWSTLMPQPNLSNIKTTANLKTDIFMRDFVYGWDTQVSQAGDLSNTSVEKTIPVSNLVIGNGNLGNLKSSVANFSTKLLFRFYWTYFLNVCNKSFGFSFYYIQGFVFVLFIDACLTDDEPLWEPLEWSLVQTWILFIFTFAWIAENLIVSRYGSYTGRDKRVWMSWYKTFWLIEGYYIINYGVAAVFVIVPFYFETNYNLSFVYSWWHWYSRVFFFKFISILTLVMYIAFYLQMTTRWLNYKKGLFLVLLVNIFLSYLIYTQFIITFLGFFTDPVWYQKTRPIDYIQLSHEPARWGWGSAKKDHFTYHGVKTVFWFKNDGPFAAAMIFFQTFLFVCIFFLYIYWITLFRRIWSMKEIPLTLTTYCVSSLRQFFYFALFMYILVFISYLANYSRMPIEFLWAIDNASWGENLLSIARDYPKFIFSIFS